MKHKLKRNMEMLSLLLIIVGIVFLIVGLLILTFHKKTKVEGGGLVLIGPLPIAFGTSEKIVYFLLILAIIIMFLYLLFYILIIWR
jgi:uncharacterized protein (TIGR00304 family)